MVFFVLFFYIFTSWNHIFWEIFAMSNCLECEKTSFFVFVLAFLEENKQTRLSYFPQPFFLNLILVKIVPKNHYCTFSICFCWEKQKTRYFFLGYPTTETKIPILLSRSIVFCWKLGQQARTENPEWKMSKHKRFFFLSVKSFFPLSHKLTFATLHKGPFINYVATNFHPPPPSLRSHLLYPPPPQV